MNFIQFQIQELVLILMVLLAGLETVGLLNREVFTLTFTIIDEGEMEFMTRWFY